MLTLGLSLSRDLGVATLLIMGQYAKIQPAPIGDDGGHQYARPPVCYEVLTAEFPYCWGVVQPVGHRTVNADGEGSNPSAPAIYSVASSPGFSMG